ncbi:MAG TPA: HlyD family secretion protein, partial [Hyphomicrobiaceae bacterium]|nr:HlyD family secretion protein [Hyphomicrobiaceae bacterium]
YLITKGAVGRFDVEISRARYDKAAAEAAALRAKLKQCFLIAPYDGRVADLLVEAHEIPTNGKPLIKIIEDTAFEIELIVPSRWLRTITIGVSFEFYIDELGETVDGKITRLGAAVDPVSQTVKLIGVLDRKPNRAIAGMSGSAVFKGGGS